MRNEIQVSRDLKSGFDAYRISEQTKSTLGSLGFESLFPIQAATFDPLYDGIDMIGRDYTGSGKTLAFCLPILERLRANGAFQKKSFIKMLIMVPTRELATQTLRFVDSLQNNPNEFSTLAVYGGTSINRQREALEQGVDILVATPGRLMDLMERGATDMRQLQVVVFDETDEMLKIGFQQDIERILEDIYKELETSQLQFLLFSATVPKWVSSISRDFMSPNHQFVNMVQTQSEQTPVTVDHYKMKCSNFSEKISRIGHLVSLHAGLCGKCIVFVQSKGNAPSNPSSGQPGFPERPNQRLYSNFARRHSSGAT